MVVASVLHFGHRALLVRCTPRTKTWEKQSSSDIEDIKDEKADNTRSHPDSVTFKAPHDVYHA